jgi:hypothetical protein
MRGGEINREGYLLKSFLAVSRIRIRIGSGFNGWGVIQVRTGTGRPKRKEVRNPCEKLFGELNDSSVA